MITGKVWRPHSLQLVYILLMTCLAIPYITIFPSLPEHQSEAIYDISIIHGSYSLSQALHV